MLVSSILSRDLNGISFINKTMTFGEGDEKEKVNFQLWDNTFYKESSYYSSCYLRGTLLCLIFCDISKRNCDGKS